MPTPSTIGFARTSASTGDTAEEKGAQIGILQGKIGIQPKTGSIARAIELIYNILFNIPFQYMMEHILNGTLYILVT